MSRYLVFEYLRRDVQWNLQPFVGGTEGLELGDELTWDQRGFLFYFLSNNLEGPNDDAVWLITLLGIRKS
jgi:hypothetical protein